MFKPRSHKCCLEQLATVIWAGFHIFPPMKFALVGYLTLMIENSLKIKRPYSACLGLSGRGFREHELSAYNKRIFFYTVL